MRVFFKFLGVKHYKSNQPTFDLELAELFYQSTRHFFLWLMAGLGCLAGMGAAVFGLSFIGLIPWPMAIMSYLALSVMVSSGIFVVPQHGNKVLLAALLWPLTLGGGLGFALGAAVGYFAGYTIGLTLAALTYAADYTLSDFAAAIEGIYFGTCFIANKISNFMDDLSIFFNRKGVALASQQNQNNVSSKSLTETSITDTANQSPLQSNTSESTHSVVKSQLGVDTSGIETTENTASTDVTLTPPPSPSEFTKFFREEQNGNGNAPVVIPAQAGIYRL